MAKSVQTSPVYGAPRPTQSVDTSGPVTYAYEYAVADDTNNFGQNEAREGYSTKGQYRVSLPDGRVQVRYRQF